MLVTTAYKLTKALPGSERFGLVSQVQRAAVSVPANIAEGYGRATRGEYLNHLSIARGSVNEVAALCAVIVALGFATPAAVQPVLIRIDALQRMLSGLRSRLKETRRESESAPHSLPAARCLTARQSLPGTRHPESQG